MDKLRWHQATGIYCFEDADNPELPTLTLQPQTPLELSHDNDLLHGVNIIKCQSKIPAKAIPYYAVANRKESHSYKVWIPKSKETDDYYKFISNEK